MSYCTRLDRFNGQVTGLNLGHMARTKEVAFNALLAEELIARHPRWTKSLVTAESTDVLVGTPAKSPDIVVGYPGESSVILETEFEPASTVEGDARGRLGVTIKATVTWWSRWWRCEFLSVCGAGADGEQIANGPVLLLLFSALPGFRSGSSPRVGRFPNKGWIRGGIDDLTGFIERAALSESRIIRGANFLEHGVETAAGRLHRDLEATHSGVLDAIAEVLHQEKDWQTTRMTMAVVANALIFHTAIAGTHGIHTLDQLRSAHGDLAKTDVLSAWREILRINYWPILTSPCGSWPPFRTESPMSY